MALLVTLSLVAVAIFWGRSRKALGARRGFEVGLAVLLLMTSPLQLLIGWRYNLLDRDNILPLHLCDLAALVGVVALLRPRIGWIEVLYFWGLAGTFQGLVTPALSFDFPHPAFWLFFLLHSGIVLAALYLTWGRKFYPRPRSWWRVFLLSQLYVLVVLPFNLITDTNYGFLHEKPPTASILDKFGPWPWYLLAMEAAALIAFLLLYLPFGIRYWTRPGLRESSI